MHRVFTPRSAALALAFAAVASTGCGAGSGGSSAGFASTASTTAASTSGSTASPGSTAPSTSGSTATPAPAPAASPLAAPDVVPVIVIHGHGGDPRGLLPFVKLYGQGRVVVPELYAAEADALKPGDLPLSCVVDAGYYKDTQTGALYDPDANGRGQGSIGGCATPRDDGNQGLYPISYAARISRIVDGVRRATGSDRVDLVCHSMGNLVGRAYTRWLSDAGNGHSKVRKLFCVAGPQRGIDALEALIDGLDNANDREFMIRGENMEMCYEYPGWGGDSFVRRLNDGWDNFCSQMDVHYGGITGTGAKGDQVKPKSSSSGGSSSGGSSSSAPPPSNQPPSIFSIFGINLSKLGLTGTLGSVAQGLMNLNFATLGDTFPLWQIAVPKVFSELPEALGPSDGTVRFESSRMDRAPFSNADFWAQFEGRHSGDWNTEQCVVNSTFATELAREYLAEGKIARGATVTGATLALVDAPGKASWLELETHVTGAPLVAAQVVEQKLDASGNPTGGAQGYAVPVGAGDHEAMIEVPAGGGARRYRVVLYDPAGPVLTQDGIDFTLTDGALETPVATHVDAATATLAAQGTVVRVDLSSDAPAGEPSLRYSYRLDGGAWTTWDAAASLDTPPLAPGEHRLEVRAEHAHNAAGVLVEDARGVAVGLAVDGNGGLTLRR